MEDRVYIAFEKEQEALIESLRNKFSSKLSDDDIGHIVEQSKVMITNMIQLMREGKSAHEKFFSDIILNSIDAIIGLDNDFKIFLWNKGAEKMYGYSKDEIIGKDLSYLIPEHKLKEGEREFLINKVKEKGYLNNFESERLTKDKKIIHVSVSRFEIYNDHNESIGSVGIVRNITKVKKLEKELREKENLALVGEVVSSIAHSLSNPLNIISGNADYLLLDKKAGEEGYDELRTIIEEASRITKSIRHLLNFSRPIRINKQKNDINELINVIIDNSKYIIGNKKINIKKYLSKDVKEFSFDKDQIYEALSNIITNSIQAIPREGEIKVKTYLNDNNVMIDISDNGVGIQKENIENIFLPFFSSKDYGKGTGLGLSITRKIIREHSGDIFVKSSHGKGTLFSVCLPDTK